MFGPLIILYPRRSVLLIAGVVEGAFGSSGEGVVSGLMHVGFIFNQNNIRDSFQKLQATIDYCQVKKISDLASMIGLYYIFFWNKSNMAFFPGAIQGMQVLWQPVVIPNNQNETIELLKKENDRLKAQLEAVLKGQSTPPIPTLSDLRNVATDRFSHGPVQPLNCTKRSSENACYSPRMFQNHQRIYSTHSPRLKDYLSPDQPFSHLPIKESTIVNQTQMRRMVISKGKDGRYYRDRAQENKPQVSFIKQSAFCRVNTAQTTVNTPIKSKSPLKGSHYPNMEDFSSKISNQRWKSPSFLKNKNRSKSKGGQNRVKFQSSQEDDERTWNESCFKRTPPTHQFPSNQKKEQGQAQNGKLAGESTLRQSSKIPTVDLSVECDSELSIERVVREYRREKKKKERCDTFLYQIQQELDGMYGDKDK